MAKSRLLYALAWAGIPMIFGGLGSLRYSAALSVDSMRSVVRSETTGLAAFAILLLLGASCIIAADRRSVGEHAIQILTYVILMSMILGAVYLGVECDHGNCL
jgi:hypothetical protein